MSYEHVGQHGAADPSGVMRRTVAATPEEYSELKNELEQIGYSLRVRKKLTKFDADHRAKAIRSKKDRARALKIIRNN